MFNVNVYDVYEIAEITGLKSKDIRDTFHMEGQIYDLIQSCEFKDIADEAEMCKQDLIDDEFCETFECDKCPNKHCHYREYSTRINVIKKINETIEQKKLLDCFMIGWDW